MNQLSTYRSMSGPRPKPENTQIGDKIVTALLIGIAIPAFLTSPFGLYVLAKGAKRYYFDKKEFQRTTGRLQKRGYIALTKTEKGWLLKLLPKGKKYAKQVAFENLKLTRSKTWDGKWRLFSFDIPEEHRNARNMMRRKLKSLGCYNIQRSLFAYPYDCKTELLAIAEHYKVNKYVLFAETSFIDIEKELRKFFNV